MARRLVIAVEERGLSHSSRFILTALGAESRGTVVTTTKWDAPLIARFITGSLRF